MLPAQLQHRRPAADEGEPVLRAEGQQRNLVLARLREVADVDDVMLWPARRLAVAGEGQVDVFRQHHRPAGRGVGGEVALQLFRILAEDDGRAIQQRIRHRAADDEAVARAGGPRACTSR